MSASDLTGGTCASPGMPESEREIPVLEVARQLHALGVREGDVLLVHTSFRGVRPVERGPAGLIEALGLSVGSRGTLVMPSWTGDDDRPFDPSQDPAASDLGVVADTFWRLPGVRRSEHPSAFAAKGAKAAQVLSDPLALPPHQHASPVGRVMDLDGQVLLLGVSHEVNTTLHLAELMAEVPYGTPKHVTVRAEDGPTRVDYLENDHCTERFALAEGWMKEGGHQFEGIIGHAPSKLMRSRALIETALSYLRRDPLVFLHASGAECRECARARASIAPQNGPPQSGHDVR